MISFFQQAVHAWVVSFGSFMAPTLLIAALVALGFYLAPSLVVSDRDDHLTPTAWIHLGPWLALAAGLLLTLMFWTVERHVGQESAGRQFDRDVTHMQGIINNRVQNYEELLQSVAERLATPKVNRDLWKSSINSAHLEQKFPTVYGVGYAPYITQETLTGFRTSVRTEGGDGYTVFPAGDRFDYFPIRYADPAERNNAILGYDLGSDVVCRAAADQTRQNGLPALTSRVTLLDDPEHHAFIYFLSVPLQQTIKGWVFLRIRQEDFLKDLIPAALINLQAFDDAVMTQNALFFDSSGFAANWEKHQEGPFSKTAAMAVGGRHWTLHFTARPAFESQYGAGRASFVFTLGVFLSLTAFGVSWAFASSRRRAYEWAQKMTSDLRLRETALSAGPHGVIITNATEAEQPIVYVNKRFEELTGYAAEDVMGKNPRFLQGDDRDQKAVQTIRNALREHRECRVLLRNYRKDGTPFWNDMSLSPVRDDHRRLVQWSGLVQDVTEREQSERRLTTQVGVIRALSESDNYLEASARLLQAVCEGQDWELGAFWNLDVKANVLRCMDIWHQPDTLVPEFELFSRQTTYPRDMGLPGYVWSRGEPVWMGNLLKDANFPESSLLAKEGLNSACGFPIASRRGLQGVLTFYSRKIWPLNKNLLLLMVGTGSQMSTYIERQQIEAQQKELTVLERGMAEFMGEGLVAMDRDGYCIYANASAHRILGYPGQMLLGQNLHEALHPSNIGRATCEPSLCPIFLSLQSTETHSVDDPRPIWRQNKSALDVTYITSPIIDNGMIQGVVLTFVDASSRRRQTDDLLRTLQEKEDELQNVKKALHEKVEVVRLEPPTPPVVAPPLEPIAPRTKTVLLLEEDTELLETLAPYLREKGYGLLPASSAGEAVALCEKQGPTIDAVVTDVFLSHTTGKAFIDRIRPLCASVHVLYVSAYSPEAISDLPIFEDAAHFLKKPFTPQALHDKLRQILG